MNLEVKQLMPKYRNAKLENQVNAVSKSNCFFQRYGLVCSRHPRIKADFYMDPS